MTKPKILLLDIETAPILGYVWGLWDNNLSLNQIKSDWHLLAWSAKWLGDPPSKIMYEDQRRARNLEDDSKILKGIWKLMDEADVIITQNGKAFDEKKLNTRFILNDFKPPSPYQHIDTKLLAARKFGFTSNKLEYMTHKLCKKYRKLKHAKFSGFELWSECLKRNPAAWKEMERYNKYDVLSLEELYLKLRPWDKAVNYAVYVDDPAARICSCGNKKLTKHSIKVNRSGKYQRYQCKECGSIQQSSINLFSKEKQESLRQ